MVLHVCACVCKCNAIKRAEFSGRALRSFVKERRDKYVQVLNVDSNSIYALPEQMSALTKLERLQAASNALISLPGSFVRLQALKVLSLAGNVFTTVPDEIGACSRLEELDLSNNCLQVIPCTKPGLECKPSPHGAVLLPEQCRKHAQPPLSSHC